MKFRTKLTLMTTALVIVIVAGGLSGTQRILEARFSDRIQRELGRADTIVDELMLSRTRELDQTALIIQREPLIVDGLRSYDLDKATWNNALRDELLNTRYGSLDVIVLLDEDGEIKGIGANDIDLDEIDDYFQSGDPFDAILEADRALINLPVESHERRGLIQWVGRPILSVNVVLGAVFVGRMVDRDFVDRVQFLSDVHVALLSPDNRAFLVSDGAWPELSEMKFDAVMGREGVTTLRFDHERVLSLPSLGETDVWDRVPTLQLGDPMSYVALRSLDQEMVFVRSIRWAAVVSGLLAVGIAIALGYFLSRGITKPIDALKQAAESIARSKLDTRVDIRSRDEFQSLGNAFNEMAKGLQERERIRGAMNKVVSKEIADELLRGDLHLGGEAREATILFSDIRGFTTLAEGMEPERLLDLLNSYFTRVSACVDAHHGIIDKYIGDAVMALFGVPVKRVDAAGEALKAALDMFAELEAFNRTSKLGQPLRIGIGINTGRVVAGNVGSDERLNYTVLGDEVNLASRLEGLTSKYGVGLLLSESTVQAVGKGHRFRRVDRVQVKGKTEGVAIYDWVALEAWGSWVKDYQEGLDLLQQRDFTRASICFEKVLHARSDDGPARVMLQRAQSIASEPALFERFYQGGAFIHQAK
ncbi:MAG: HAMP domain-containing protein [Acidobacteria bacterium]|nr:HAMP domain-containing protein [Acidobacteriota bacterium]